MNISRVLVGVVAGSLLLSGCAGEKPAEIAEPAPIVTESPSPTPTPTPEPTKPALDELVLTTEGLGYLVIGQPVPSIDASLAIVEYDPAYCESQPGAWRPTYPTTADQREMFNVQTDAEIESGSVSTIAVYQNGVVTAQGIHVGSTSDEVLAAYSSFDYEEQMDVNFVQYGINGSAGRLLIGVEDEVVVAMVAERKTDKVYGIWRTDAYHPCA